MSTDDERRRVTAADLALAVAIAPAIMLLAIAGLVLAVALGPPGGGLVDPALLAAAGAYVLVPPLTTAVRARARRCSLGGTCLLLAMTILAMAASFWLLVATLGFVHGLLMARFD